MENFLPVGRHVRAIRRISIVLLMSIVCIFRVSAQGVVDDQVEYAALKDFYLSTGGHTWLNNSHWPSSTWPDTVTSAAFDDWFGVVVENGDVVHLELNNNNLTGTVPGSLASLTQLRQLYLGGNQLDGTFPVICFSMSGLQILDLAYNRFTGSIPSFTSALFNLFSLSLSANLFTGDFPDLSSQTNLYQLNLAYTAFTPGPVPSSLAGLTNLSQLYLERTNRAGTIPAFIGDFVKMTTLSLQENRFTGAVPATIGNLTQLSMFYLYSNQLESLPASIGKLDNLYYLDIANNSITALPDEIGDMAGLVTLWAENNKLQQLPASLIHCPELSTIAVSRNKLTILPDLGLLTRLTSLQVSHNKLSGSVPSWISRLANLTYLHLDNNYLEGTLPPDWTSALSHLQHLQLDNNNLSGPLPDIGQWTDLQFLKIAGNYFSGGFPEIPASLVLIDANYNEFTSIPSSVFSMSNPYYLNLYGNHIRTIRHIARDISNGTVQPKAETGGFSIGANYLDFSQLVPLKQLNLPVYAFPQREFNDITQVAFTEGGTICIATVPVNSTTTVIWEKHIDGMWTDVSTQTADTTGHTYLRSNATLADEGLYRWRMTDSQYPGETLQSVSIMVKEKINMVLNELCYEYRYDARDRKIKEKVPGADWVYKVYDARDRLVLTQDGAQRKKRQWLYTRYDALNRPVSTGLYTHGTDATQEEMAALVGGTPLNETYTGDAAHDGYTTYAFTGEGFNTADNSFYPLTVTYYDTYDFCTLYGAEYTYVNDHLSSAGITGSYAQGPFNDRVVGQVTGTKARTLPGNGAVGFWLKNATYYDDKYRVIQRIADHVEGGTDRTSTLPDFTGRVLKTRTTHTVYDLQWQEAEGVSITGSSVTGIKWGGEWATGVSSGVKLPAGSDGWIEAVTADQDTYKMIGFGASSPDAGCASINYAIDAEGTNLVVYESGVLAAGVNIPFVVGDVLRIARVGTTIQYARNGMVFHETANAYTGELLLDISMYTGAATWHHIRASYVTPTTTVIDRAFEYDHTGRLLKTWHSIDGRPPVLLSLNAYNELGQLVDKKLHSTKDNGSDNRQSIDYRYNIRGWVTSINNTTLSNDNGRTNDDSNDLFGINLHYEKPVSGITSAQDVQYNGNISAITHSNGLGLGSVKGHGYAFTYDAMNRLRDARQKESTGAGNSLGWHASNAFREQITGYDLNGNILGLNRTDKTGSYQDVMRYTYAGNQLMELTDYSGNPAGFHDQSNSGIDYHYDENGNMDKDRNKSIDYMIYNHLNLPQHVRKLTGEYMQYLYDATGRKLSQQVYDRDLTQTKRSDYAGEFYYEDGKLQFISHEEGRIVIHKNAPPEYQYHLKDYLGNVRLTFTTKDETEITIATLEDDEAQTEQGQFLYYDEAVTVNQPLFDHTHRRSGEHHTTTKSMRLLGGNTDAIYGLARSVSVMPGDVINLEVYAKYVDTEQTNWNETLQNAMAMLGNPASPGAAIDNGAPGSMSQSGLLFPLIDHTNDATTGPKAYLNYIVFGRDMSAPPLDMGFVPIPVAAKESGTDIDHMPMAASVKIKEAGFIYIYLSNENPIPVEVFFDDFKVEQVKSPVVQTDEYYPGGATFNSYKRENSVPNKTLFQETELQDEFNLGSYDFAGRYYDPFTWRTPTLDPHAKYYEDVSPYNFLDNNPINTLDPTGMDAMGLNENRGSGIAICTTCPNTTEFKPYIDDPNNTYFYDDKSKQISLLLPEVEVSNAEPPSFASVALPILMSHPETSGLVTIGSTAASTFALTVALVLVPHSTGDGEMEALERMRGVQYISPPKVLLGFPNAKVGKRKSDRKRWINDNGDILEWDSQHGDVEVYDRRGKHKGSADPDTGEMTKPPVPGRTVDK